MQQLHTRLLFIKSFNIAYVGESTKGMTLISGNVFTNVQINVTVVYRSSNLTSYYSSCFKISVCH